MKETQVPQVQPDPPRVSVIIITRNQARALRRCLEALHQCTILDEVEIIVVDNASTDGSNVIQDDFEKITYLKLPKNFGWTKAANIALRSSLAESILFLDPRVELAPDAIAVLAAEVSEESDAAAASAVMTTPDGAPARVMRKLPKPGDLRPALFAPSVLPTDPTPADFPGVFALLIRKAFLKGMNFLDERYGELWADAEIAAQVKRAGRKILLLPAAKAVFRIDIAQQTEVLALISRSRTQERFFGMRRHGNLKSAAALVDLVGYCVQLQNTPVMSHALG